MKIAILGYGKQGRSAYEYWREGNQITVCDSNERLELPDNVEQRLGPDHLKGLDKFDLIVRSPIVYPADIVAANSPAILDKVTTVTNEFFKVCPTKNIIGVTGTKGKGTTSTLIAKMLEADDHRVHLGGNIGTPPLDMLRDGIKSDDWVVLELANFQLIDLRYSPHIAVCLAVVPEHLDWHEDHKEYITAKQQLFARQTSTDIAIYFADNEDSRRVASASKGVKIPYFETPGAAVKNDVVTIDHQAICNVSELKLPGKHNWQNVCAAVTAAWQVTKNSTTLQSVLTSFKGLPYRIEFRQKVNGIRYYNDSFAASPPAPLAAIESIVGKKVVIMGGFDRQLELGEMVEGLLDAQDQIRKVLLVGAAAQRIAQEFKKSGFNNFDVLTATKMSEIVHEASEIAHPGDAVVLSPGFPSFDMFDNFEDRGNQFNKAVEEL